MTDEETIQRPKGRRNNSIDLGPTHTEQPVRTEKKQISFGKRREDQQSEASSAAQDRPATTEQVQRKPIVSFGRKKADEEPPRRPEPFKAVKPQPQEQREPVRTERTYSASIDMSKASTGQHKASIDLGSGQPRSQPKQPSVDLGKTERKQTAGTMDLGTAKTQSGRSGMDIGPSAAQDQTTVKTEKKRSALGGLGSVIPLGKKTETEDRKGTWGNTGYSASNEQAHRDVTYHIPSFVKQTMVMFMVQMKLFSKMKWTYFMLFVALLIPIIFFLGGDMLMTMMRMYGFVTDFSNTYIAGLLAFLPLLLGLFTSILCGSQLPNEFKERTAYMNVSLPMSRASFYLGKYLAGFVMSLAIFMFAYGMAIATSMTKYDAIFADLLSSSLALTIVGVFAYSATAFCIGSFMRRGSSMVPFILMTIALPLVCTLAFAYFQADGPDLSWLFVLPCFLGESALGILGAPMSGSVGMIVMPYLDLTSITPNVVVGIVWGILFLILGLFKTIRREM